MIGVEPRVVSRKEHRISRRNISPNALRTLYRLQAHGFIAYLVGGCVRDLLLGRTPKDFDVGTNATPGQIKRLFRNCRLIGRRFRLAHLHFQDEILEVSTFRGAGLPADEAQADEAAHPGRFPRHLKDEAGMVLADNVFGTPEQDALRRDFTINALAYDIADSSVIDYSTGLADLKQRLIRTIGDPDVRFTEDPVRMLRAVRFAASHDFVIEQTAWESICGLSSIIARVSPSRLYEEALKLFLLGSARPAANLLEKSGLLGALFPASKTGCAKRVSGRRPLKQTSSSSTRPSAKGNRLHLRCSWRPFSGPHWKRQPLPCTARAYLTSRPWTQFAALLPRSCLRQSLFRAGSVSGCGRSLHSRHPCAGPRRGGPPRLQPGRNL